MKLDKQKFDKLVQQKILKSSKVGDLTTYAYIHGGVDFTDRDTRLARGLTLDESGNVILVGFEKFFCLNQLETYTTYDEKFKEQFSRLQKQDKYDCLEKLDGSLILSGAYDGKLVCATTSAVDTEIALRAKILLIERLGDRLDKFLKANRCYVFEYIGKSNTIAVRYDVAEDLVLLRVVDLDTLEISQAYDTFGFAEPKQYEMTYDELIDMQRHAKNFEGVVVQNAYGNLIKVKTDWWYANKISDVLFTNKITKRLIDSVVYYYYEDMIDELLSYLYDYELQLHNVKLVIDKIEEYKADARKLLDVSTLREMYEKYGDSEHITLAVALFRENEELEKRCITKMLRQSLV